MFFPKAMSEIELIVPSRDLLRVMRIVSGHGVFHQVEGGYGAAQSDDGTGNSWQEKSSVYAGLERRLQNLIQTLGLSMVVMPSPVQDVADVAAISPAVEAIESDVKQITDALADRKKRLEQLQSDVQQLEPVDGLDLDLSTLGETHFVSTTLGVMPAENVTRLQTSLSRVPHLFLTLREDPKRPVVWLAGNRSNKDILDRAARSAYLEALALPTEYSGQPAQVLAALRAEIGQIRQRISGLESDLSRVAAGRKDELMRLVSEVHASRVLTDAIARFGRLRHTYIMVGWVPNEVLGTLTARVKQVSPETLIESVPATRAGDKTNVPVALQDSKWLRPFQMLVTTYARPRYGELDPTWLIALSFPFLFGAMFGDVGHGFLLAAFGLLVSSRKIKPLRSLGSLGGLVVVCGLVAAAFGFLYGSLFGYEDIIPALWLRPSQSPIAILSIAVGAGVLLLFLAFLIGILNAAISRDWPRLIFGHNGIAGLLFYVSALRAGAPFMTFIPVLDTTAALVGWIPGPSLLFVVLLILGAAMIMFSELWIRAMEGEHPLIEGNPVMFVFQGFMELFEVVLTLLSNTLSYIRIGAFAIAHAVLISVVFRLAGFVGPEFGLGYWIVTAIGTLVIVLYEGLIVGIQAMRLSYYEFFSKFFTGGGTRFEPLVLTPAGDQS